MMVPQIQQQMSYPPPPQDKEGIQWQTQPVMPQYPQQAYVSAPRCPSKFPMADRSRLIPLNNTPNQVVRWREPW